MGKKRYLAIGCIILGIWVMMIPSVKESVEDQRQQKILTQWKQEMNRIGSGEKTAETGKNIAKRISAKENSEVVGVLRIPIIELEQPVLKGATEQNRGQTGTLR